MKKQYDVAAYIWPAYTGKEPRAWIFWNEGYGEWQSVRSATAKFEGHTWPRKPLWGYVDEADPYVMDMEIEAAIAHGVNVFIYDWYWYDHRPFLENCLNDGFLKAPNRNKMKFYLCWANHDGSMFWDKRNSDRPEAEGESIWDGATDRKEFERVVDRVIHKYFVQENYYKIDGCPVFNIYYLQNLIKGLGGIDQAADALNYFREETKKAGFPGLHIQLVLHGDAKINQGEGMFLGMNTPTALNKIKVDTATHYQTLSFTNMNRDYAEIIPDMVKEWEEERNDKHFLYFPHVSIGWDNNPRTHKFMPTVCKNNTPENFEKALREAKAYIDRHDIQPALVTINSWNEWTETSYLQPDDIYGYGYLEAVKRVFVDENK